MIYIALIDRFLTIFCSEEDTMAQVIIHSVATEAGIVGLVSAQIPGDRFVIGTMQIDMVMRLAKVYGKRLDRAKAIAIIKAAIATVIGPEAVNQVIKYVPGVGNIANMTVAGSITEAIGWIAVDMFETGTWFDLPE